MDHVKLANASLPDAKINQQMQDIRLLDAKEISRCKMAHYSIKSMELPDVRYHVTRWEIKSPDAIYKITM